MNTAYRDDGPVGVNSFHGDGRDYGAGGGRGGCFLRRESCALFERHLFTWQRVVGKRARDDAKVVDGTV